MKRMKKLFRMALALVLAALVLGLVPVPAAARSTSDIQAEIDAHKDILNALEADINASKSDRSAAQAMLDEYEVQYNELLALIDEKEAAIALRENEVDFKTTQIATTMENITRNQELFVGRIRAIYEMNSPGVMMGTLLSVDSFSDFALAADVLRRISENDTRLLETLAKDKKDYEAQQLGLETAIAQLGTELADLDEDRAWCAQKMAEMQGQIDVLNTEIADSVEATKKSEAEIQELQNELARLAAAQHQKGSQTGDASQGHSGPLAWPVAGGQVSSWFGDPRSNTGSHYGLDIRAPADTPVLAAAPGVVITAEWHPSYGNFMVIDHGQGLQTWYAHMNYFAVGAGTQVAAGTQVGGVGNTGDSEGYHLHFEVHDGGVRQNPAAAQYLNM